MEDRTSLLERLLRFESPIEDTVAMLAAYGWASDQELVRLAPSDVVSILDRFLEGELTDRQVAYWAELLEMREDVGYENLWADHLRRAVGQLASPEVHGAITPGLVLRMRRVLAGDGE